MISCLSCRSERRRTYRYDPPKSVALQFSHANLSLLLFALQLFTTRIPVPWLSIFPLHDRRVGTRTRIISWLAGFEPDDPPGYGDPYFLTSLGRVGIGFHVESAVVAMVA